MLTSLLKNASNALAREEGFTIVELLVVMVAGTIIMIAVFAILDTTLTETTRTFTKLDSIQRARTTLENIENELHSACIQYETAPIQANSTGTQLSFISQYGNAATLSPVEHKLTFSSSAGTLTDSTYALASGTDPQTWTFSTTASSTTTLLTNISQYVVNNTTTPMFQYFDYQEPTNPSTGSPYEDADGNPYEMILDGTSAVPGTSTIPAASPLSTPLSTANAQATAEVLITMVVRPPSTSGEVGTLENPNDGDVSNTVTDSIGLRLTPPANHVETGAVFDPCY